MHAAKGENGNTLLNPMINTIYFIPHKEEL